MVFFEQNFADLKVVAIDSEISRTGAKVWSELERDGNMVPVLDLLIAATALTLDWALATFDRRYFRKIQGLEVIEL